MYSLSCEIKWERNAVQNVIKGLRVDSIYYTIKRFFGRFLLLPPFLWHEQSSSPATSTISKIYLWKEFVYILVYTHKYATLQPQKKQLNEKMGSSQFESNETRAKNKQTNEWTDKLIRFASHVFLCACFQYYYLCVYGLLCVCVFLLSFNHRAIEFDWMNEHTPIDGPIDPLSHCF